MVLDAAAERRSPRHPLTFPVRWEAPDPAPSPLNGIPADLYNIYARTELCRDCGKVSALRSLYQIEFSAAPDCVLAGLLGLRPQLLQTQKRVGVGRFGRPYPSYQRPRRDPVLRGLGR